MGLLLGGSWTRLGSNGRYPIMARVADPDSCPQESSEERSLVHDNSVGG
jgi:hypothetical protein